MSEIPFACPICGGRTRFSDWGHHERLRLHRRSLAREIAKGHAKQVLAALDRLRPKVLGRQ